MSLPKVNSLPSLKPNLEMSEHRNYEYFRPLFQKEKKRQWLGSIGRLDLKRSISEEQLPRKEPRGYAFELEEPKSPDFSAFNETL